jgi:LPXTG-site transpeptidase (sortase) family protein
MKKQLIQLIIGVTVGIAFLALGLFLWQIRDENSLVNSAPGGVSNNVQATAPKQATISGHPNHLDIPSLNMSLPIIDGVYNQKTKEWTLTLNKVQYATITPPPNNYSGNTFIYGHYRPEVFARLHTIKPNSLAIITTDNNHKFTYQLTNIVVTNPGDDTLFTYSGPPELTIQTCTGLFFQNRQLFTFKLVGVQ